MKNSTITVSFIIPTLNEEKVINDTINNIKKHCPRELTYEIIIVDNGSSDNTLKIASELGAVTLSNLNGTIAKSRNIGAKNAKSDIYVFIDADVSITEEWSREFPATVSFLMENPYCITGSRCMPNGDNNWISRLWFEKIRNNKENYINSGHMITTKLLFDVTCGFNQSLETSEDYDISQRCVSLGGKIVNNKKLTAIHYRYPKTTMDFIKREMWHGTEDFKSFSNFKNSIIAMVASFHCIILVASIVIAIIFKKWNYIFIYLFATIPIVCFFTLKKFKHFNSYYDFFATSSISYLYIIGRSLSFFKILSVKLKERLGFRCNSVRRRWI
jgi:glycosyltransferase involved in cell wall biosynthesis